MFLSQQYRYLSIAQINPFSSRPSHSAIESQSCRFSVKIFSRSSLDGGGGIFFYWDPNPLSAALKGFATNIMSLHKLLQRNIRIFVFVLH